MREEILKLLRDSTMSPEAKYEEARTLLRKSPGHNLRASSYYNRAGFTSSNLKNICYDLQKLHKVSNADITVKAANKAQKGEKGKVIVIGAGGAAAAIAELVAAAPEILKVAIILAADYPELDEAPEALSAPFIAAADKFSEENAEILKLIGEELEDGEPERLFRESIGEIEMPEDVKAYLEEVAKKKAAAGEGDGTGEGEGAGEGDGAKDINVNAEEVSAGEKKEVLSLEDFKTIDQEAAEGLKVRVEFPFLNDDDCPDKLKILVADRITAWNKYKAAHAKILKHESGEAVLTDAELYEIGKEAVDKFELNQLIWDELNYYNEHKEILGAHPIFSSDELKKKVDGMSDLDADKRRRTLKSYVSRENKKLKAVKTPEAKAKIEEKLQEINDELVLVEAKLGTKE